MSDQRKEDVVEPLFDGVGAVVVIDLQRVGLALLIGGDVIFYGGGGSAFAVGDGVAAWPALAEVVVGAADAGIDHQLRGDGLTKLAVVASDRPFLAGKLGTPGRAVDENCMALIRDGIPNSSVVTDVALKSNRFYKPVRL